MMVHPAREKELTEKKEMSLLHVLECERKLKEMESNMKIDALYDSGNAKMSNKFSCIFLLSKTNIDVTMAFFVTKMKINIYDII